MSLEVFAYDHGSANDYRYNVYFTTPHFSHFILGSACYDGFSDSFSYMLWSTGTATSVNKHSLLIFSLIIVSGRLLLPSRLVMTGIHPTWIWIGRFLSPALVCGHTSYLSWWCQNVCINRDECSGLSSCVYLCTRWLQVRHSRTWLLLLWKRVTIIASKDRYTSPTWKRGCSTKLSTITLTN